MSVLALAVPSVIGLIQSLIPSLSSAAPPIVASTISVLAEYAPLVVAEYKALKPVVAGAIEALAANPNTMPEQLAKLREMSRVLDADFDDALSKARAEDAGS
jgi:hypothetical protein